MDRGSDSGIQKYMPVIVPTGLVGFVSEVYQNSARVQLLLDPRTSVGGHRCASGFARGGDGFWEQQ